MSHVGQFFDNNPFWTVAIIWLFAVAFMCILADAKTAKVRRIKRILVSVCMTFMIWGVFLAGLYDAAKLMPPVPAIKSPTVDSSCSYTVKP